MTERGVAAILPRSHQMPMDHEFNRREDDRTRALVERLDVLERGYHTLERTVSGLDATVKMVQAEQGHLKELFDARFKTIEKGQELMLTELRAGNAIVQSMSADPEKSPAGKVLLNEIFELRQRCDEYDRSAKDDDAWKNRINGVVGVLQWMGWSGVIALLALLIGIAQGKLGVP